MVFAFVGSGFMGPGLGGSVGFRVWQLGYVVEDIR